MSKSISFYLVTDTLKSLAASIMGIRERLRRKAYQSSRLYRVRSSPLWSMSISSDSRRTAMQPSRWLRHVFDLRIGVTAEIHQWPSRVARYSCAAETMHNINPLAAKTLADRLFLCSRSYPPMPLLTYQWSLKMLRWRELRLIHFSLMISLCLALRTHSINFATSHVIQSNGSRDKWSLRREFR